MIVGEDIVTLLFRHREFGADSVRLTSSVFFWHMSGLAFIAMNRVLAPAFYARGDTKTPTWAGLVSVAINVGLAFALVGPLKAPGIALALAGASAVNTLVLVVALLRARIPGAAKALAASGRYSLKLVLFSILAGLPVLLIRSFLAGNIGGWNVTLAAGVSLAATALAFGGIGLALLALSRDEMASTIVKALRRRGSKA
jgi:putative peptidoglycan lipid II flippase